MPEADAEDLTQEFLLHLMQNSALRRADPERGRFRSFLLGALVLFLADKTDQRNAQKRGGRVPHVSLDDSECSSGGTMAATSTADMVVFDREWAMNILESAFDRVREEFIAAGRNDAFEVLKNFLPGAAEAPGYEQAAELLGVSLPAFKSEVHRLRQRLRALVRQAVAETVAAPHEIEEEMTHLQRVLMDRGSDLNAMPET